MNETTWKLKLGPRYATGGIAYATVMDGPEVIADMRLVNRTYNRQEASLITHAPAMHAMLTELHDQLTTAPDDSAWDGWRHAIDDLLTAISRGPHYAD